MIFSNTSLAPTPFTLPFNRRTRLSHVSFFRRSYWRGERGKGRGERGKGREGRESRLILVERKEVSGHITHGSCGLDHFPLGKGEVCHELCHVLQDQLVLYR